MKLTAIFMAFGTALAAMSLIILRCGASRTVRANLRTGEEPDEYHSAIPLTGWSLQVEEDFSPDAFREELLK